MLRKHATPSLAVVMLATVLLHAAHAQRGSYSGGRPASGHSQKDKYAQFTSDGSGIESRFGNNQPSPTTLPFGAEQRPPVGWSVVPPLQSYVPLSGNGAQFPVDNRLGGTLDNTIGGGQGLAGQNLAGQGFAGQGFGGQGFAGQGFAGQGFAGQGVAGQNLAAQGFPGQGFAGQGVAGQNFAGQGFAGQGVAGQRFAGQGVTGQNFPGQLNTARPNPGQANAGQAFAGQTIVDPGNANAGPVFAGQGLTGPNFTEQRFSGPSTGGQSNVGQNLGAQGLPVANQGLAGQTIANQGVAGQPIAGQGFAGAAQGPTTPQPVRPAQSLPLDAGGDQFLIDKLNALPEDQRPFWFLNYQQIEAQRNGTAPFGTGVVHSRGSFAG